MQQFSAMNTFLRLARRGQSALLALVLAANFASTPLHAQNAAEVRPDAVASSAVSQEMTPLAEWKQMKGDITMYMANDLGRNGYYDQKPIAELMGWMAGTVDPECVLAVGDIHHFNGVVSTADPLWTTNYERIYSHPDLMIDWFPVCGNHEYRGNTQAVLDYAKVSRRWMMPSRYYTRTFTKKGVSVRIVFLDTTPLINKYRTDSDVYPDAVKQDDDAQLAWLDATLKAAKEDWVVVVGHHPIYADTGKSADERLDMQRRVMPVLHRYGNVSIYACGHIHNFQHIRMKNDPIDYVVNSSASLSRKVNPVEGTVFCSSDDGYSVLSFSKTELHMYMVNKEGHIIHTIDKKK